MVKLAMIVYLASQHGCRDRSRYLLDRASLGRELVDAEADFTKRA